jgi:hypothetical protein
MSTPSPGATLRARWLVPARVAWVVMAITVLAIILFSIPSSFEHYSSVCTAVSEVCSDERTVDQPTPEGVRALQDAGLSVRTYALLNVIVDKVFQLVWFAVGALIFWRRSDDRMALLVSVFLLPASLVVARLERGHSGQRQPRAVLLPLSQRTIRAALDALARSRVYHQ